MITPNKAFEIITASILPLNPVIKPLSDSHGFILSENIHADSDLPSTDRSAMDGFAVRAEDLVHCPCSLQLIGEVAAGSPIKVEVLPETCVRILTGAAVPSGADTVVKIEDTEESGDKITFHKFPGFGSNIRKRGEESFKGDLLLDKGTVLDAIDIGLCASVGKAKLKVFSKPGVAVICTGAELRKSEDSVQSHQIRDSNGPSLVSALRSFGFTDVIHKIVLDDVGLISKELASFAKTHEVILITGGVSVGKYDYVPKAVKNIGATIRFHGVSMKPGKPLLYAALSKNRHIFGLPGNPLSVMTGFYEFVLPSIKLLSGIPANKCRTSFYLPLSKSIKPKKDRVNHVIAKLIGNSNGTTVEPLKYRGSADLTSGSNADGVIIVPTGEQEISVNSIVEFRPWRTIL